MIFPHFFVPFLFYGGLRRSANSRILGGCAEGAKTSRKPLR
jgi:hypothetical protein